MLLENSRSIQNKSLQFSSPDTFSPNKRYRSPSPDEPSTINNFRRRSPSPNNPIRNNALRSPSPDIAHKNINKDTKAPIEDIQRYIQKRRPPSPLPHSQPKIQQLGRFLKEHEQYKLQIKQLKNESQKYKKQRVFLNSVIKQKEQDIFLLNGENQKLQQQLQICKSKLRQSGAPASHHSTPNCCFTQQVDKIHESDHGQTRSNSHSHSYPYIGCCIIRDQAQNKEQHINNLEKELKSMKQQLSQTENLLKTAYENETRQKKKIQLLQNQILITEKQQFIKENQWKLKYKNIEMYLHQTEEKNKNAINQIKNLQQTIQKMKQIFAMMNKQKNNLIYELQMMAKIKQQSSQKYLQQKKQNTELQIKIATLQQKYYQYQQKYIQLPKYYQQKQQQLKRKISFLEEQLQTQKNTTKQLTKKQSNYKYNNEKLFQENNQLQHKIAIYQKKYNQSIDAEIQVEIQDVRLLNKINPLNKQIQQLKLIISQKQQIISNINKELQPNSQTLNLVTKYTNIDIEKILQNQQRPLDKKISYVLNLIYKLIQQLQTKLQQSERKNTKQEISINKLKNQIQYLEEQLRKQRSIPAIQIPLLNQPKCKLNDCLIRMLKRTDSLENYVGGMLKESRLGDQIQA